MDKRYDILLCNYFSKVEKKCCMETISGDLTAVDYFAKSCLHIQCAGTINEATQFIYSFEEMHSGVSTFFCKLF